MEADVISVQERRQEETPRRDTGQRWSSTALSLARSLQEEQVASENQRREQAVLDQQRQKQTEQERRQEEARQAGTGCGFIVAVGIMVGIVLFLIIRSC